MQGRKEKKEKEARKEGMKAKKEGRKGEMWTRMKDVEGAGCKRKAGRCGRQEANESACLAVQMDAAALKLNGKDGDFLQMKGDEDVFSP